MKNLIFLSVLFMPLCLNAQADQPTSTVAENSTQMAINVRLDVPIVQQQPGSHNCWEASLAMILAWRQRASVTPEDITGDSEFWNQWCNPGLDLEDDRIFQHYRLTVDRTYQSYTPEDYARILQDRGPIWVGLDVSRATSTELRAHAVVITGIAGDGTAEGTMVYLNNPGRGGQSEALRFVRFEQHYLGRYIQASSGLTRDETGATTGFDPDQRREQPLVFVYP